MGVRQEENLFTPDGGQAQGKVLLLQIDLQFVLQAGKPVPLKNLFLLEQIGLQGRQHLPGRHIRRLEDAETLKFKVLRGYQFQPQFQVANVSQEPAPVGFRQTPGLSDHLDFQEFWIQDDIKKPIQSGFGALGLGDQGIIPGEVDAVKFI